MVRPLVAAQEQAAPPPKKKEEAGAEERQLYEKILAEFQSAVQKKKSTKFEPAPGWHVRVYNLEQGRRDMEITTPDKVKLNSMAKLRRNLGIDPPSPPPMREEEAGEKRRRPQKGGDSSDDDHGEAEATRRSGRVQEKRQGPGMVELPPPPPEYVWPEEGEAIEVEAAEDGVTAWIASVVTQVLEDGWFQARIGRGKRRGEESDWFDWFTWQEEGRRLAPAAAAGGGEAEGKGGAAQRRRRHRGVTGAKAKSAGGKGDLKLKSMRKKLRLRLRIDHEAETADELHKDVARAGGRPPAARLQADAPRHRRDRAAARQLGRRARRHARARALLGPTLDDWVEGEIVNHTASGKHGTRIWFIQSRYTLDFGDERGQHDVALPDHSVILLLDDGNDSDDDRYHQRRSAAASSTSKCFAPIARSRATATRAWGSPPPPRRGRRRRRR